MTSPIPLFSAILYSLSRSEKLSIREKKKLKRERKKKKKKSQPLQRRRDVFDYVIIVSMLIKDYKLEEGGDPN